MSDQRDSFTHVLKRFLHDPIDKPFDIKTHEKRAREYAKVLGISGLEEAKTSDQIASCMERSLLPKDIRQDFNEIRHPLSEGAIDKSRLPSEGFDFEKIEGILREIRDELDNTDDKKKFLYLWRNLQEKIIGNMNSEWKKLIPLLPADTRIPDHSIWEHLKIASAINTFENWQNNSLFLFSIGPVQSFISQARKTQDLYMGSFLLSYLTFIGITVLIEKFGPTCIIYPDLFGQPFMDWYLEEEKIDVENSSLKFITIPTIPNRFVAIITETDEKKIKEIAEGVSKGIRDEWEKIMDSTIGFLKEKNIEVSEEVNEKFKSQISDFPEIYWTAIPWRIGDRDLSIKDISSVIEENEIKKWNGIWEFAEKQGEYKPNIGLIYGLIYTALEKSVGARKNLRDFRQSSVEEKGRKCSLCGERDVLFFCETDDKKKKKFDNFNKHAYDLTGKISPKYLSNGEGLCGICFIKRTLELYLSGKVDRGFKDITFPSTAEIACADFKERILGNDKAKDLFNKYIEEFKDVVGKSNFPEVNPVPKLKEELKDIKNLEGEWFFEENLTEKAIKKYIGLKKIDEGKIRNLQKKLKNLTKEVREPNPYYAVIMFDGDNMGKWLAGELLPAIEYAYNREVWEEKLPDHFKDNLKQILGGNDEKAKKLLTPAIHASISTALRNYSLEFVRKIVEEEHLGKLVYAGGDDVLAFVNLKDLLPVMIKLRAAFSGQIKIELNNDGKKEIKVDWENESGFVEKDSRYHLTMGKNATASMGVVIAHYKMPLKVVLDKAREMERLAKDKPGKDSFAIGFFKRSGEAKITGYRWRYRDNDEDIDTIDCMIKLKEHFTKKENDSWLSKSFVYKLDNALVKLKDRNGRFSLNTEAFNSELKRLIRRAINGGNKEQREQTTKKVFNLINRFFWTSGANIDYLVHLLEVCAFLSGEEESR